MILQIGQSLARQMPQLAIATASVFFHRFYVYQSFKDFDRRKMASACVLLAGKVEEAHRKCFDILEKWYMLWQQQKIQHKLALNPNLPEAEREVRRLQRDSKEYVELKEELLIHERILLQTIAFDLTVEHPYPYLLRFVKKLNTGTKSKKEFAQLTWNFLNDSLRTTLCLQYKSDIIALAMFHTAAKIQHIELSTNTPGEPWWQGLAKEYIKDVDVSIELLEGEFVSLFEFILISF